MKKINLSDLQATKSTNQFIIEGREWFGRTNGNTYHCSSIYMIVKNGDFLDKLFIANLPSSYGGQSQYYYNAVRFLKNNNLIGDNWRTIFDHNVKDVKKSQLFKDIEINENITGEFNLDYRK